MIRRFELFLPLALLLALALGCGLSGLGGTGGDAPPPAEVPSGDEEAVSPTDVPSGEEVSEAPGAEAESEEEEVVSLPSVTGGLQGLDSYRSHFKMTFEGTTDGEAETWVYEMDMEAVRDPFAQRVVVQGALVGESLEAVQIGDQQYFVLGEGQCISSSADEDEMMDTEIFEPDDVIGGLENARRVRPDEQVNGIPCRHYKFDETSVVWGGFAHAEGEIWIAVEGDYVVRYTLQADGGNPVTGDDEGHVEWEYEVRDVNEPIAIEPPAGCAAAESDFPIMPDAMDMTTMGSMVMYTSASAFDDVLAFYQEQMPANGWSSTDDSFVSADTAMLGYTKEGRSATITLGTEDGAVSVLIMSE